MALTPEWRARIDHWQRVLRDLTFVKLTAIPLDGFVTCEQLTAAQARNGPFRRMEAGTLWGATWEYAWFRGRVRLPAEAQGKRIVLRMCKPPYQKWGWDSPGDGRVLINGTEQGGADWAHTEILLAANGRPGSRFDILIERYAGHGPMESGGGPVPDGQTLVAEPPRCQRKVVYPLLGIWVEDLYQAWLDVQTLLELRDKLDANSLRVSEIDDALRAFTTIADLELPHNEMVASVCAGRKRLRAALACKNGTTAAWLYCFGHSHIDVAWMWPLRETAAKCARTFGTQLALMQQYPEYKFLQSQAYLYWLTKRQYPDLYKRIQASVKQGQWLVDGGMWVEPDTNIAGGEALIRQFLFGKRWFREEFGVESELAWLPDVFGYSGALPQIMAGCGIRYFATQKIFWNYNGCEAFPYNTFWWEGIDGTRVLSHIYNDYGSTTNAGTLWQRWAERTQKEGIDARLVPFGHSDGGGGATRDHLEYLRRAKDLEGLPRTVQAGPLAFFRREEQRKARLPCFVGELYYPCHRGTYTSQARTKNGNRQGEFALREAELWGAAAQALGAWRYPARRMEEAWSSLLLNQFHDILPGTSIARVHAEAETLHADILEAARSAAQDAMRSLLRKHPSAVTVFNSLSWARTELIPLPLGWPGAAQDGRPLPVQKCAGIAHVEATLPPCGWTTLQRAKPAPMASSLQVEPRLLENEFLRVRLNGHGEITSLFDKQTGREWAAAPLNAFRMWKDVPRLWDAWDIDAAYKETPVALPEKTRAEIKISGRGPLVVSLHVRRLLHHSRMTQEIRLRRASRTIEFHTRIDWQEKHKLLKVCFPFAVHTNEALHEIQFGHLKRPNHASRPCDAERFEVPCHKWSALCEESAGAAILNDSKYGISAEGGSLNLTLLRAPQAPAPKADLGVQEFVYACQVWNTPFAESRVVQGGYELNTQPRVASGTAAGRSLLRVSVPNVVIETVKPAEDGSGDLIVRLYEAYRMATTCTLNLAFPARCAWQTDMLEGNRTILPLRSSAIDMDLRPLEIKTIRISVDAGRTHRGAP